MTEEQKNRSGDVPKTTDVDLEGGIFNMVISLVHYYLAQGWAQEQACENVAGKLEGIANGLRQVN